MKLVYNETGKEVQIGDEVIILEKAFAVRHTVTDIVKPKHGGSTGRVYIRSDSERYAHGFYPSVIGATWIEREDQGREELVLQDGFGAFSAKL